MANKQNRYKDLERIMTIVLIADAVLFFVFLISAGFGITWLKIITAIVSTLASGICLAILYLSGEILKQRSLWMSAGFAAIVVCLIFSLLLDYPSPAKNKVTDNNALGTIWIAHSFDSQQTF